MIIKFNIIGKPSHIEITMQEIIELISQKPINNIFFNWFIKVFKVKL